MGAGDAVKMNFRFSLWGLFAVVTIVALSVSHFLTTARLTVLENEVVRLRQEAGHLSVADATQVHLISVPTAQAMNWRWRVFLPPGHDFGLYAHLGKLDSRGFPEAGVMAVQSRMGGQTNPNEPREILLDVALGKTLEGDPCLWVSENGRSESCVRFGSALPSWADGSKMLVEKVAGQRVVVTAEAAVPLGLVRLDGAGTRAPRTDDAVLIWIGKYEKTARKTLLDKGILPQ